MQFRTTIPPSLVKELEEAFPDRSPGLGERRRVVWFNSGQVSVVRILKDAVQEQQNAMAPIREIG